MKRIFSSNSFLVHKGRKKLKLNIKAKPLSQRATGTRKGNLVAINSKHTAPIFPIQGGSNAQPFNRFISGTLVNNVSPNASNVKVINENNREYLVPVKNLKFRHKNLMKHHDVEITTSLPDLPRYRGNLAEDFNGETFRFKQGIENERAKSVNAGNVLSFINHEIHYQKERKLENKNRLVKNAELSFMFKGKLCIKLHVWF